MTCQGGRFPIEPPELRLICIKAWSIRIGDIRCPVGAKATVDLRHTKNGCQLGVKVPCRPTPSIKVANIPGREGRITFRKPLLGHRRLECPVYASSGAELPSPRLIASMIVA